MIQRREAPCLFGSSPIGPENSVAATFERLADDLLRLALRVPVGGVDEVDPGIKCPVNDPDRVVVVGVAGRRPEHHGAERVGADLDAGPAEGAVLHAVSPEVVVEAW
jgi:hypothetical protein